jgi:hypothetical protein
MTPTHGAGSPEVRLDVETIELLADRVASLLLRRLAPEPSAAQRPDRLLSAAEVSAWWGVKREWVYQHAAELGAIRIGDGERPRLRFDPDQVAVRLDRPRSTPPSAAPQPRRHARRSPRIHADSEPLAFRADGELSSLNNDRTVAGRRANAPGRGAEDGFGTTTSLRPPKPGVGGSHPRPSPALRRQHDRR